jgi:RNA polymerase sigma-70 factor, ECF subfamily
MCMTNEAELLLIIQLKAGWDQAVARWFHDYSPAIEQFITTKISVTEDVDELVQEVFLACLRELVHFRGEASLKTWMLTIARYKVADYYRARYAKKVIHLVALFDEISLPLLANSTDQITVVQETLQKLSPTLREVLLAKYIDGKSVKQLAQELAKTTKTIEAQLFRARNQFKQAYAAVAAQYS